MTKPHDNLNHEPDQLPTQLHPTHLWLNWLIGGACVFYILSAITLPFANKVWIGEMPIFGLLQLPKAFLKSVIHDALLIAVQQFGWSAGSRSPDYIMTHLWAMISMTVGPALILLITLLFFRTDRRWVLPLIALISCATIDAVATLGFDAWSNLKLFNGSFL
ncbi:hypothetical protein [uncultured Rubinisphaera sp.]|uniref:hypothetical protein n=1 Tax=uncultured Rubinisphaera sp. TaxID=1678686 RepID=UPI0030DB9DC6